jgi:hypothetical protein
VYDFKISEEIKDFKSFFVRWKGTEFDVAESKNYFIAMKKIFNKKDMTQAGTIEIIPNSKFYLKREKYEPRLETTLSNGKKTTLDVDFSKPKKVSISIPKLILNSKPKTKTKSKPKLILKPKPKTPKKTTSKPKKVAEKAGWFW